jgi:hypothetical protein
VYTASFALFEFFFSGVADSDSGSNPWAYPGGWLTDDYSWRWVFYINIPVGNDATDNRSDPSWAHHEAGLQRGISKQKLQKHWHYSRCAVEDRAKAEVQDNPDRKISILQHAQIDDRIGCRQFPYKENDKANDCEDGQTTNKIRSKPVVILAFVEHYLQAANPQGQEPDSKGVQFPGRRVLQERRVLEKTGDTSRSPQCWPHSFQGRRPACANASLRRFVPDSSTAGGPIGLRGQLPLPGTDLSRVSAYHLPVQESQGTGASRHGSALK